MSNRGETRASIRNRNRKWQARITRKGEQPLAKSFQSKQDAECIARFSIVGD